MSKDYKVIVDSFRSGQISADDFYNMLKSDIRLRDYYTDRFNKEAKGSIKIRFEDL